MSARKAHEFAAPATVVAALSLVATAFSFDRDAQKLSLQPDGYHKAALASGGTYNAGSYFSPPRSRVDGLEQLVDASSTIVVASVSDAVPELLDEGRYIRTNYRLQSTKSIKGNLATTDLLEMPGGTYRFSDGSVVNQVEEAWKALQTGKTYKLFLTRWPDRPNVLRLTSAAQGIFKMDADGQHLVSDTYLQDDSLRDEASLGKAAFLEKVKSIVTANEVQKLAGSSGPAFRHRP